MSTLKIDDQNDAMVNKIVKESIDEINEEISFGQVCVNKKQFNNPSYYPFIVLILVTPFLLHKSYELVFSNLKHAKVNNLFFIYFVLIISLFFIFNFLSKLPFSNNLQPE